MTVVYPSLTSSEFERGFQAVLSDIAGLGRLFDECHIAQRAPASLDDATVRDFDRVIARYNEVLDGVETLGAYIASFVTTDSRDDLAQAKMSELQQQTLKLEQLDTRLTAWIGALDVDALLVRSHLAGDHAWMLRKAKIQATHLMSPAEEDLSSELNLSGGTAWAKLHSDVSSQVLVPLKVEDATRELPMTEIRNLAYNPDREVRRRAYEAELAAWAKWSVPLAAALNSIKGQVNTLTHRRGWETPLDEAVFGANIDHQTLDAMMTAARESFPDFRRYLCAKARALGISALAWYDIFAPVGASETGWTFADSSDFIIRQFGTFSPKMSDFAARAFRERWIDAEPRPGKVGGAFCMPLRGDESRILSNYQPSYEGMSTLAHELGHGYHNLCLNGRSALQRATPMTLAETASIFCETIVRHAALKQANEQEQRAILEASVQGSCQVVVDITSRFLFESRVFEKRRQRELSVDEFNELMLQTQRETYGDGLDQSKLHPYMWAVKGHYYSPGLSYYNFPYMFGLLFGLGLYARYQADADAFRASYDELLASTGQADAATLAARFGINIRSADFWRASLGIVRADIDRFEELVGR
jgi:pepF/M3 family oligoendopeptidase